MWIGSLAYGTQWSALALGVGAGAILQVMVEVTAFFLRGSGRQRQSWLSPPVLSGFLTGVAFMYVTAAVIKV